MKKIVFLALMSTLFMIGCCKERTVDINPKKKKQCSHHHNAVQSKDNGRSALEEYVDPANPIGLFRDNWSPSLNN
jgi:hypothetical protein